MMSLFFKFFSCNIDKSYLVDVVTKLYIATDSNPVDVRTYELCSDLVDVRTEAFTFNELKLLCHSGAF